jgi:hypothetical protein
MSESEGVSKSFDPRFSRAFQPGYDERVHREEPPAAVARDEPRVQGNGAASSRDESPMFAVPAASGTTGELVEGSAGDGPADEDAAYPAPWWRRVNPWFLVLWGLGLAFIVVAIVAIKLAIDWQSATFDGGVEGQFYYILMNMTMQGAPLLIVLGLATLTSTVVIQAARWHRSA